MTENELRELYLKDMPIFQTWGEYVQKTILDELSRSENIDLFLKIPPQTPRLKTMDSLIAKALHRQKPYTNPYKDITDKVGIRFVVLLTTNIAKIADIIEKFNKSLWRASKDKDFENERNNHPEEFTYESLHYVVYNKREIEYNSIIIPSDFPCEIQIRTLLQHAYAEMAHDTTYKPQVKTNGHVKRYLARSMALVESADCFFIEALKEIDIQAKPYLELANLCLQYYPIEFQEEIDTDLNNLMIDTLYNLLKNIPLPEINSWLVNQKTLVDALIKQKHSKLVLCRQPAILLIYYLIDQKQVLLDQHWKWPPDQLHALESDMGITPMTYGHQ